MGPILLDLAYQAGVSVVAPQVPPETTLSVNFANVDAQRAFESIGTELGLVADFDGESVSFTAADKARRDFLVLRPGYLTDDDATRAIQAATGGKVEAISADGRVYVSGSARDLEQAISVAERMQRGPDGWMLEVRIYEVSRDFRKALGLDTTFAGRIAAALGAGSEVAGLSPLSNGASASLLVELLAEASESGSMSELLTNASLYLLEGREASIVQGDTVPVPQFTTSPEGTVSTTGFTFIETGLTVTATGRRVPAGLYLELRPSISAVRGFVEQAPIIGESTVEGTLIMRSGEWAVLSGLQRVSVAEEATGIPGSQWRWLSTDRDTLSDSELLMCVNARRVFSSSGN